MILASVGPGSEALGALIEDIAVLKCLSGLITNRDTCTVFAEDFGFVVLRPFLSGEGCKPFPQLRLFTGCIKFALVHTHDFAARASKQALALAVRVQDASAFHIHQEGRIAQMFK